MKAKHDNLDFGVHGSTFADQEVDLTGKYPVIIPHKPLTDTDDLVRPPDPALANASDSEYFSNPRYTFWRSAMDHIEHSRGHEWAFKGDVGYNFLNDCFLKQLKFGARYADRKQAIKYTTYNWGSLSEVWTGQAVFMDQIGAPEGNVSPHSWDNFFRGDTAAPPAANYLQRRPDQRLRRSGCLLPGDPGLCARERRRLAATSWSPLARAARRRRRARRSCRAKSRTSAKRLTMPM